MASVKLAAMLLGCLWMVMDGCTPDRSMRAVAGPYQTWNEVIERWIGGATADLYLELGPPNLHPHTHANGMTEMVWDYAIDHMPGQAEEYQLLPLGGGSNCQVHFFADAEGIVQAGSLVGCD